MPLTDMQPYFGDIKNLMSKAIHDSIDRAFNVRYSEMWPGLYVKQRIHLEFNYIGVSVFINLLHHLNEELVG